MGENVKLIQPAALVLWFKLIHIQLYKKYSVISLI